MINDLLSVGMRNAREKLAQCSIGLPVDFRLGARDLLDLVWSCCGRFVKGILPQFTHRTIHDIFADVMTDSVDLLAQFRRVLLRECLSNP